MFFLHSILADVAIFYNLSAFCFQVLKLGYKEWYALSWNNNFTAVDILGRGAGSEWVKQRSFEHCMPLLFKMIEYKWMVLEKGRQQKDQGTGLRKDEYECLMYLNLKNIKNNNKNKIEREKW